MKVLDLCCSLAHTFEGWFASEGDFQDQLARSLVACPLCGDTKVYKKPSAPRLNLSGALQPAGVGATAEPPPRSLAGENQAQVVQAGWLHAMRRLLATTEDVGDRFAQEARRIHHGEVKERSIRGHATPRETASLLEEGIAVSPLAIPDALKETLQ